MSEHGGSTGGWVEVYNSDLEDGHLYVALSHVQQFEFRKQVESDGWLVYVKIGDQSEHKFELRGLWPSCEAAQKYLLDVQNGLIPFG